MKVFLSLLLGASALTGTAAQAITADGTIGVGEYAGALTTVVTAAPGVDPNTQGPGSPGSFVENVGYTVYYTSDTTNVYVGLQSATSSNGLAFANLYFDANPPAGNGSDIGFEVLNNRAFVPGVPGYSGVSLTSLGATFASSESPTGDVVEFTIPWSVFMTNALGLNQPLVAAGGQLQLRTSQSFNYAGATGDTPAGDGIARFGFQNAPTNVDAVPEPATWGMMLLGFGLVGATARRRRATAVAA